MQNFTMGQGLRFSYENYRGETSERSVIFKSIEYGSNEWYPEPQWFIRCWDFDKQADRSFALARIDGSKVVVL